MTDNHFHWYRDGGFGRDWGDFTLDKLISCENFMENGKSIPLSHCHRSQQIVLDWSATAGKTTAEKATIYLLSFDLRMRLGLEGVAEASKIAQRTPLKNIPGFTKVNPLVRACAKLFYCGAAIECCPSGIFDYAGLSPESREGIRDSLTESDIR